MFREDDKNTPRGGGGGEVRKWEETSLPIFFGGVTNLHSVFLGGCRCMTQKMGWREMDDPKFGGGGVELQALFWGGFVLSCLT